MNKAAKFAGSNHDPADHAAIGGPLTDAAIKRYALEGRYGKAWQQHYARKAKLKAVKKPKRKSLTLEKILKMI